MLLASRRRSRPMSRSIFPAIFWTRRQRAAARVSAACGVPDGRRFHRAVRSAARGRRPAARRLLPRLDHRQFRAARSVHFCATSATCWGGRGFVVGVDLVKDPKIFFAAYNDAEGVTAKFNLNLLARINRELGANFDLAAFEHHACYNASATASRCTSPSEAAEGAGRRRHRRFPRRRDHPYREQLQIHDQLVRCARPWQRLDAAQGVDRRIVLRARTDRRRATPDRPPRSWTCRSAKPIPGACNILRTSSAPPTSRPRTATPGPGIPRTAGSTTSSRWR